MDIVIYSKTDCNYCSIAENNLQRKKLPYKKLVLETDYSINVLTELTGKTSSDIIFPIAIVNGELVQGAKDLHFNIRSAFRKLKKSKNI